MFYQYQCNHGRVFEFLCKHILNDEKFLLESSEDILLWEPNVAQQIVWQLLCFHFGRRIVECLCFERLHGMKMHIKEFIWEAFLYWGLLGTLVGFSVFHTGFIPLHFMVDLDNSQLPGFLFKLIIYMVFIIGQTMNFLCRMHFQEKVSTIYKERNDRQQNDLLYRNTGTKRLIFQSQIKLAKLHKFGYGLIIGAELYWELLSWISFTVILNTYSAWFFLLWWSTCSLRKAYKRRVRNSSQKREERYILIPYIL